MRSNTDFILSIFLFLVLFVQIKLTVMCVNPRRIGSLDAFQLWLFPFTEWHGTPNIHICHSCSRSVEYCRSAHLHCSKQWEINMRFRTDFFSLVLLCENQKLIWVTSDFVWLDEEDVEKLHIHIPIIYMRRIDQSPHALYVSIGRLNR